jgi:hypothetical protein
MQRFKYITNPPLYEGKNSGIGEDDEASRRA